MIEIKYELTSYHRFLEQVAKSLGTKIIENTVYFPDDTGHGYIKHIELAEGVDALLCCFRLTTDLYLERKKNKKEYYTFCCDFVTYIKEFSMTIEQDSFR
ncbi:MAG: hypothetical protein JWM28_1980, partial [Chitinophagaceae bacterium]|nr:hypothetical protein [Chitinophagaceae bacterium]